MVVRKYLSDFGGDTTHMYNIQNIQVENKSTGQYDSLTSGHVYQYTNKYNTKNGVQDWEVLVINKITGETEQSFIYGLDLDQEEEEESLPVSRVLMW